MAYGGDEQVRKAVGRLALALMVVLPTGGLSLSNAAQAAAPKWNEQSLSDIVMPDLQSATWVQVEGLTCATSTMCVATGQANLTNDSRQGWVATYDGSGWNAQYVAVALNDAGWTDMGQVACSSPTMCVAVGYYATTTLGGDYKERAFASHFDGSTWTDVPMGAGYDVAYQEPYKVDCSSSGLCMAGGWEQGPAHSGAFVATFDGTSWTASDVGYHNRGGTVNGVSCAQSSCTAVGYTNDQNWFNQPFAATFDGSAVNYNQVPYRASDAVLGALNRVSCPSDSFCVAGGSESNDPGSLPYPTLFELQNGQWTSVDISALVAQNPFYDFELNSVDCPSEGYCLAAVGMTVLTRSGGTWSSTVLPMELRTVSCASETYCAISGWADGKAAIATKSGSGAWQRSSLTLSGGYSWLTCPAEGACTAALNGSGSQAMLITPQPSGPGVVPGFGSLNVSWTATLPAGSPAVARYVVTVDTSRQRCRWLPDQSGCTIGNLQSTLETTVTVQARDASGTVLATAPAVKAYALRIDKPVIATKRVFLGLGQPEALVASGFAPGGQVNVTAPGGVNLSCTANDLGQCAVTVTISDPGWRSFTVSDGVSTKTKKILVK